MRSGKGLEPAKETEKEGPMKLGETQENVLFFFLIKKNLKFNWFTILQRKCMVKKPKEGITDKRLSQRQSYWIRQEMGHCVLEERNFNRMDGMEALNTERTPGPFFVNSFTKI